VTVGDRNGERTNGQRGRGQEQGRQEQGRQEQGRQEQDAERDGGRVDARQAAGQAADYLAGAFGQPPEAVVGVGPDGAGGWLVTVEMLELARVPDSTDILGSYEVALGADGSPQSYRRLRRFQRSHVGEE
jgi:hypothetical protein